MTWRADVPVLPHVGGKGQEALALKHLTVVQGLEVVGRVLRAGAAVMDQPEIGPACRRVRAMRIASRTRSVRMCLANCQPTTWREKTSRAKLKNTTPSQ